MQKKTYTSGEVADLLGIPARTARRYLADGKIPAQQNPITGTWTIHHDVLLEFMKAHNLDTSSLDEAYRVMVVDDEPSIVTLVTRTLQRSDLNVAIESSTNGYDALIMLGNMTPHLVVLDSRMPGTDGRQVLEAIRKNTRTHDARILVISGFPQDLEDMLALGADQALAKPFKPEELLDIAYTLLTKGIKNQHN